MAPGTVFAAFSVLKDHVKFKVNQNSVAIDNIGNKSLDSDYYVFYYVFSML